MPKLIEKLETLFMNLVGLGFANITEDGLHPMEYVARHVRRMDAKSYIAQILTCNCRINLSKDLQLVCMHISQHELDPHYLGSIAIAIEGNTGKYADFIADFRELINNTTYGSFRIKFVN